MRINLRVLANWRVIVPAAAFVVLAAAYVTAATIIVKGYSSRISALNFYYDGQLEFTGQDFLSPMDSNMAISGTIDGTPAFSASTQFLGTWGTHDYSGEANITAGKLYFNLSGPQMPTVRYRQSSFLLPLKSGQWYSQSLDDSAYDNLCDHTQTAPVAAKLDLYRTIKNLKISLSPWVNFFAHTSGLPSVHLSGSVSGTELAALYDAVSRAEPPGCSSFNTLGLSADDLKHVSTRLDLYTAKGRDQLILTLTDKSLGATARLVVSTYNYGLATPVQVPPSPTSINAIYSALPANLPKPSN